MSNQIWDNLADLSNDNAESDPMVVEYEASKDARAQNKKTRVLRHISDNPASLKELIREFNLAWDTVGDRAPENDIYTVALYTGDDMCTEVGRVHLNGAGVAALSQ